MIVDGELMWKIGLAKSARRMINQFIGKCKIGKKCCTYN